MRYCLHVELPCTVDVGQSLYQLELIDSGSGDGCWLRARDCEEPVVFLLARFPNRWEAGSALLTSFEIGACPFHHAIMERLIANGLASRVPRPARPVLLRHRPASEARPKLLVQFGSNATERLVGA